MKMLEHLRMLSVGGKHKVVSVTLRGDHSVNPPVEDLRHYVELWLQQLLPEEETEIVCDLEVERRRNITARPFYGVKPVCLASFNPQVVELRVRPKKSAFQWNCHLVCASSEVARLILLAARPELIAFFNQERKELGMVAPRLTGLTSVSQRSEQAGEEDRLNILRRMLKSRSRLRPFCAALEKVPGLCEGIDRSHVHREICSVLDRRVSSWALRQLVIQLVDDGILEPHQGDTFTSTPLFDEYAADNERQRQQGIAKQLNEDKESALRTLESLTRQVEKVEQQLLSLGGQKQEMTARIAEIENELRSLSSND